jgi:hypothetical protein
MRVDTYSLEEKKELTRLMCEDMVLREHSAACVARYVDRLALLWLSPVIDEKESKVLSGETSIVDDEWLDDHADFIADNMVVSIPNPNQVGTRDGYIVGLLTNKTITDYRKDKT